MIKRLYGKVFVVVSVIYLAYGQIAAVSLQQYGIVLKVKNLLATDTIEDQKFSMTRSHCGYNGIQPVEFIVKNKSDVPVRISAQSVRATRIPKEQLIIQDSCADLVGMFCLAGLCLGLPLWFCETLAIRGNNIPVGGMLMPYINGQYPSFPVVTIGWSVITVAAFILTWGYSYNKNNVSQLAKLMLADEIVIQPGQAVRKIAFLDAQYYNGLFTFQVLSDDKKRYVASFDVELFD